MKKALHLWEVKHAYYCNETAYEGKTNGKHNFYNSWADFYSEYGGSDEDYNLVFRWDWEIDEGTNQDKLYVFVMGQRKGFFSCHEIYVCKADEPEIRKWLTTRMRKLWSIWEPLSLGLTETGEPEPNPEPTSVEEEQKNDTIGECECCNFKPIKIHKYENYGEPPSWICDLCASTSTSNAKKYNRDDSYILTTLTYCANSINQSGDQNTHKEFYNRILRILETQKVIDS